MKKHKYLASFPSDRWERLKRDAKRRGVSYNVVINDALDDSHMRYMYGPGLFENENPWHDCKLETPKDNKWLILAFLGKDGSDNYTLGPDYYRGTYNETTKKYYYMDFENGPDPDYWMYIPELKIDEVSS